MQLSHYLKVYPYEKKPGYLLLYSENRGSMILMKEEDYRLMEKGEHSPSRDALLSKLGMLVPDREIEKQSVMGFIDKLNNKSPVLNITVVLNMDCNFSCLYCYEGNMKGEHYMSEATVSHLIEFIKKRFTSDKNHLLIDFYGGEPLLSTELIKRISNTLRAFTKKRGATYSSTMISNGSLFTRRVAEEMVELGLESIKITIDGPEEVHNRYRPFKTGRGSFNAVIKNIKETWDLVKIEIGGNFDQDNYRKFPLLLDYLLQEGITPEKIFTVKFDPVIKDSGRDGSSVNNYQGGCLCANEPWILRAWTHLRGEVLKRGYHTPKLAPMTCIVESKDACVVNYDGRIYKCPAFIGKEAFAVGDLQTGIADYTASHKIGNWKNSECADCEHLPLCFGGCRYMTFLRDGNIDGLDCRKHYLDNILESIIKQDIEYRLNGAGQ